MTWSLQGRSLEVISRKDIHFVWSPSSLKPIDHQIVRKRLLSKQHLFISSSCKLTKKDAREALWRLMCWVVSPENPSDISFFSIFPSSKKWNIFPVVELCFTRVCRWSKSMSCQWTFLFAGIKKTWHDGRHKVIQVIYTEKMLYWERWESHGDDKKSLKEKKLHWIDQRDEEGRTRLEEGNGDPLLLFPGRLRSKTRNWRTLLFFPRTLLEKSKTEHAWSSLWCNFFVSSCLLHRRFYVCIRVCHFYSLEPSIFFLLCQQHFPLFLSCHPSTSSYSHWSRDHDDDDSEEEGRSWRKDHHIHERWEHQTWSKNTWHDGGKKGRKEYQNEDLYMQVWTCVSMPKNEEGKLCTTFLSFLSTRMRGMCPLITRKLPWRFWLSWGYIYAYSVYL